MLRTIASELPATGSLSTRWFHGLFAGKTVQPPTRGRDAPAPVLEPLRPLLELGLRVVAAPSAMAVVEAHQGPVGGHLVGLEVEPFAVADHERGAVRPQQGVDVAGEPAAVAELEAVPPLGQCGKSALEPLLVALEVRRQLPDDRPELRRLGERRDPLVVACDAL